MKKQNIFLICFILVILTLSIGYAIFTTSTVVIGKSAIVKNLDVEFINIDQIKQEGSKNATAKIMPDKKRVLINVPNLMYKGAYAIIPITIKNVGNIPAQLNSIYEYGTSNENAIKVSYDGIGVTKEVLQPGDTASFSVKVSWDGDTSSENEVLQFILKFNYIQV